MKSWTTRAWTIPLIAFALLATTFGATLFQLTQGIALMRIESFADSSTQAAVWAVKQGLV